MEKLKEILSLETIQTRVKELAQEISASYPPEESLVFIGTLKGAFIFLADLVRFLPYRKNLEIDFIRVISYGLSDTSSGKIIITKDIETPISGKSVLLIEDIIDTGLTLSFLIKHLRNKDPKSLKICALLDKKERRKEESPIDFVGFTVERGFLVGYGLDYAEKYRHLPGIYEVIKNGE